jgi:predicted metal-dependent HD superfamily phosphohydrolase
MKHYNKIKNILKKYNITLSVNDIEKMYSSDNRFYHTIDNHINPMVDKIFDIYNNNEISEKEFELLILSALFHDIVYIPGRDDNEKKSGEVLYMSTNKVSLDIQKVYDIIIDTKYHTTTDKLSKLFQDIDMDVIANGDIKDLLINEILIYKEYSKFGLDVYLDKRIYFLNDTLLSEYGKQNVKNISKLIDIVKNYDKSTDYIKYLKSKM